ncbi:CU044_5270 family protein [Streptomyces sp. NBC_01571]|uniref:CU044_5270 family protein n=1 Tax=Streptomyces sp. NBC_01571 TaxID=2975883 RepID=UPI00224C93ED|nr:CU044_5270 family protein [Streptomyces sp. NBC_01571]MCX4572671.1 CU044_5270 family protein [Streptomyces sp. NBC_01571]
MNAPKHGHEVERQELSHLLPRPGTPGLSPARSQRLEEYLMQEVTQTGAQTQPSPAAKRGMPRWSLIAAPAAALAVAAAVAVSVTGSGTGPTDDSVAMSSVITVQPASAHGATAFLSQVADAAGKQKTPTVGAHQFIYVKSKVGFTHQVKQRTIGGPAKLDAVHQRQVWLAADPSKNGLIHEGGQNTTIHNSGPGIVNPHAAAQPPRPGTVPQIASLSTNPDTLLKQIYTATRGQAPGKDAAAFNWVGDTVSESIVPGNVASAIWRAAAKIPGVVLVKDATDAAGRHGEAIAHVSNGERTEYIFDRNTHLFLGERSYLVKDTPEGKAGMLTGTSAILSRAVVNKIGDLPAGARA